MSVNALALSATNSPSPVHTPSISFAASAFTRFTLTNSSCFFIRQKSAINRLSFSCRCGALAINGPESTSMSSDSGIMLSSLFQQIGLNEKETKAIFGRKADLRMAHFESIRSRIKCLQSAGINGLSLSRLIAKRPDVLIAQEIDALLCFILNDGNFKLKGKIKPSQIEHLLKGTEPKFLVGFEMKVRLLHQFGIPKVKLIRVLNTVNLTKALCLKPYEKMERTLEFLKHFGGVDLIIRRPATLNYDLETELMPKIAFLMELSGGDEKSTAKVLRKFPLILAYSVANLKDHVGFLNSYVGLSYEEIFRIILVYPTWVTASIEKKLRLRINFLKECGLSANDMYRFLMRAPLFLTLSHEGNIVHKLVLLVKIGYRKRTKELAMAMGAVTRCSCKTLQDVIGILLNYGFTCEDILYMSKKYPQVLAINPKSLEGKLDYLIEDMGRGIEEVLAFPAFLGYNLNDRIKYRYEVMRKILGDGMSINRLLNVSEEKFSTIVKQQTVCPN